MKTWLRKYTPTREVLMQSKWLKPLGFALGRPGVWQLNRKSAALGVAIGLMAGLLPGPTQILSAVLLALLLKANLPTAALTTLYTNPITIIPLYMLAYQIGSFVTGDVGMAAPVPTFDFASAGDFFAQTGQWIYSLGDALVIGLAIQGSLFALAGYFTVTILWRLSVGRKWRARKVVLR